MLIDDDNAKMAQFRQSGTDRFSVRGNGGGASSDHVTIGIRNGVGGATKGNNNRWRRSVRADKIRRLGIGSVVFVLCFVLLVTVLAYCYISGFTYNSYDDKGQFFFCSLDLSVEVP